MLRLRRLTAKLFRGLRRILWCFNTASIREWVSAQLPIARSFLAKKNYMSGLFSSRQLRAYRTIVVLARLLQRPIIILINSTRCVFSSLAAATAKSTSSKYVKFLQLVVFGLNGLILLAILGLVI